jgi:hypothetical protein
MEHLQYTLKYYKGHIKPDAVGRGFAFVQMDWGNMLPQALSAWWQKHGVLLG